MIGNNIVADTNIFIDLMKGNEAIAKKLESFDEVYLSPIVLVELYFGAYRAADPAKHLRKIAIAIQECKLQTIDAATADIFVAIKLALFVNSDHVDPAFWDVDPPAKRAIRVRA